MTKIVDQYSDPAFGHLVRITSVRPALEEFVKEASIEASEEKDLPATAFAWPEERKFPIHTNKYAALSYGYALEQKVPEGVLEQIKQALEVYGVPLEMFKADSVKVAAENPDDYLLPDLKFFRVKCAADVKTAERGLIDNLTKLDIEHRATACGNLVKKAAEFNVPLHTRVMQLAGFVVSSTKIARDWLEARASIAEGPYKLAFARLADAMKREGEESKNRDALLKVASVVAELDEKSGLDRHYDRKLPDALQTIFNTEKVASATVDLGGKMVPLSKLAHLPASFWEDLGGKELSNEICPGGACDSAKLAAVVDTLPLDLKLVLRSQIRA